MTREDPGGEDAPLSDDDLLALLNEVQARERAVRDAARRVEDAAEKVPEPEREGEPCPNCGELALALDECHACGMDGCLPRDDWVPGFGDPCLTRCARCGMHVHVNCAYENEAGNPVCCGPRAADSFEAEPYGL